MSATQQHYREVCNRHFADLLRQWLATLPPEGFHGTIWELGDSLNAVASRAVLNTGSGLSKAMLAASQVLRLAGWRFQSGRNWKGRFVEVRPLDHVESKSVM